MQAFEMLYSEYFDDTSKLIVESLNVLEIYGILKVCIYLKGMNVYGKWII